MSNVSRGIRNNNPFNIKKSLNSWKGKLKFSADETFEQFQTMDYGLRAGFQLLRGYIARGFDTTEKIINRFAPTSENNVARYINFVCEDSPLAPYTQISVNSLTFFWLCQKILRYESHFELSYDRYIKVVEKFRLW